VLLAILPKARKLNLNSLIGLEESTIISEDIQISKPYIHAESSARRFGGKPEDYLPIHNLLDSSKGTIADSRHRALTHNTWFIGPDGPLERIFGVNITNSDGRLVSVRDLGEQHILEDFGGRFIPSAQDYLQEIEVKEWMVQGKGAPPSFAKINDRPREVTRTTTNWKSLLLD
jgi:hypothetical protein